MTQLIVADDHPFIIAGLEAILRDTDFDIVATCADGQAVLDAIALHRPHLLLMDVSMPLRSGIEVVRTLRARRDALRIVLFTASLEDRQLAEAIDLGVEGIVLKESAQSQLLICLEVVRDGGQWIEPALAERPAIEARELEESPLEALSPREREVASLVALGLRNREIALRLGTSEGTIKVYLHRVYEKCGVGNRTELAHARQAEQQLMCHSGTR